MTQYVVEAPDGSRHLIEGPDEAGSAMSPADKAYQAGITQGRGEPALVAGIDQAARQYLPGNIGKYVGAEASALTHGRFMPSAEDVAFSGGISRGESEGSPIASTIGGTAGGVGGAFAAGGALNRLGKAVPVVGKALDVLSPSIRSAEGALLPGARIAANVGKAVGANAALGAATGLANGQNVPEALQTGAISGVAGPALGAAGELVISKLAPASQRAYMTLAKVLGVKPQELQDAINASSKVTGSAPRFGTPAGTPGPTPPLAGLASLAQQGRLKELAMGNSTLSEAAIKASRASSAPLADQIAATNGHNFPQTLQAMKDARNENMAASLAPVRDNPVTLAPDDLRVTPPTVAGQPPSKPQIDPVIAAALRPDSRLAGSKFAPGDALIDKLENNQLTVGDMENIRYALRNAQDTAAAASDKTGTKTYGNAAEEVERLASAASPEYAAAMDSYRKDSAYMAGFEHGRRGMAYAETPKGGSLAAKGLKTPEGQQGYEHGQALYTAEQALRSIAPGSVEPEPGIGMPQLAHATAALSPMSAGVKAYHAIRAMGTGTRLSEAARQIIAKQLVDPGMVRQGVANLRRGQVSLQDIGRIGAAIGGVAGQRIAQTISQGQQQ